MQILINNNEFTNKTVNAEINNTLNEINRAEINITSTNTFERNLLSIDNEVTFIDNNDKTLKFIIVNEALTENNSIKLICRGIEEVFANEKVDISNLTNTSVKRTRNATYNNVSFSNIINDLIAPFSSWSLSTTITATIGNYRVNDDQSYWNAIAKLCNEQAYEIDVDYINKEILIEENLGNNQVATLNEDIDFEGTPTYTIERAKGKKVIVYGKGDGDFQIKATATDAGYSVGSPVIKIYDSNIITNSQAQTRANNELTKLKQNIKHYIIPQLTKNFELNVSDTIILNSESVFIENEKLKIVRVIYSIQGDTQFKSIEVTNAEYSRAFKTAQQRINEQNLLLQENNTNMQGSGNTLNWSSNINANSNFPLKTYFNIPEKYVNIEQGSNSIIDFEVDYEISEFKESAGSASEDFVAPNFRTNSVTGNHNHDVIDNGHNHFIKSQTSSNTQISFNESVTNNSAFIINNSWVTVGSRTFTRNYAILFFNIFLEKFGGDNSRIWVRIRRGGTVYYQEELYNGLQINDSGALNFIRKTLVLNTFPLNTNGFTYFVELIATNFSPDFDCDVEVRFDGLVRDHQHSINSVTSNQGNANTDEQNRELGLFGGVDDHKHNVQVGTDLGEASSINSTGASLFLDYWNGSSWVQKHSVTNISGRIGQSIDISNNGQFPDEAGNWRLRTTPNSSTPDYVQSVIRLRHNLDN